MQETGNNLFTDIRLSIRLRTDGFSFSTPVGRKDFQCAPEDLLSTLDAAIGKDLLRTRFTTVRVMVDTMPTRVPLDEFRSEEVTALYKLTFAGTLPQDEDVHYEVIPALNIVELFPVNRHVLALIRQHFPHATVHGLYGQQLDEVFASDCLRPSDVKRLYVSMTGKYFFLFAFSNRKLVHANTFNAAETSNRLFYTLSTWKMLEMDQRNDECIICGKDKELVEALKKYIYKISCV